MAFRAIAMKKEDGPMPDVPCLIGFGDSTPAVEIQSSSRMPTADGVSCDSDGKTGWSNSRLTMPDRVW